MTIKTEKSLTSTGHGILETHVTWEDIENEMRLALNTSATFGLNKKVTNIGEGNGFGSKMGLIEPDWQSKVEGEQLPEKIVAKICTTTALLALIKKLNEEKGVKNFMDFDSLHDCEEKMKMIHNNEVHVYYLMKKYNITAIPRAKTYSTRKFTEENPLKGFILMEYIGDLALVHLFSTINPNDMDEGLQALAAFEALTFKISEEEKKIFCTKPLTQIFNMMFTEKTIQSIVDFLRRFDGKKYKKEMKELMTVIPELVDTHWCDAIPKQLGMTPVLCHGDLWSANVLWKKYGETQQIAAIIDYQTAHIGNPAGDLSRFFCANLSGADRRTHAYSLLEKFYNFLRKEMTPRPMPYTLEQLKEAYLRYQPVSGFLLVALFGSAADLFLEKVPEEERDRAKQVLEEKLGSLVVEVLELHKRNKKLRGLEKTIISIL